MVFKSKEKKEKVEAPKYKDKLAESDSNVTELTIDTKVTGQVIKEANDV